MSLEDSSVSLTSLSFTTLNTHWLFSLCPLYPSTSQGHKTHIVVFIHDYRPAPLPVNATEMALSLHVLTSCPADPYECEAALAINPILTHLDRQGNKELPLKA